MTGAIGPLTVSLSNSPDADDAGFRVVTFDQVKRAHARQVRALIAGGVDVLLVETIFDSLDAKAALAAIREVFTEHGGIGKPNGGPGSRRPKKLTEPVLYAVRRGLHLDAPIWIQYCDAGRIGTCINSTNPKCSTDSSEDSMMVRFKR